MPVSPRSVSAPVARSIWKRGEFESQKSVAKKRPPESTVNPIKQLFPVIVVTRVPSPVMRFIEYMNESVVFPPIDAMAYIVLLKGSQARSITSENPRLPIRLGAGREIYGVKIVRGK